MVFGNGALICKVRSQYTCIQPDIFLPKQFYAHVTLYNIFQYAWLSSVICVNVRSKPGNKASSQSRRSIFQIYIGKVDGYFVMTSARNKIRTITGSGLVKIIPIICINISTNGNLSTIVKISSVC